MKKITSVLLAIIIVGLTVVTAIGEPISAKAEEAAIVSFINDSIELIRENDAGKDFVAVENNTEDFQLTTQSVNDDIKSNDTDFQTCRLIVKSDKKIDELNSIGIANGFKNYYIVQFATPEDAEKAYNIYSTDKNIISVTPDKVFNATCEVTVTEETVDEEVTVPDRLDSWGGEVTGLYDAKDYIEANYTDLDEIVVGVIDSGIYLDHEFFKDRIVRTFFNSASDGEENDESDTIDGIGHGTNVSGVIIDSSPYNVKVANYKFINKDDTSTVIAVTAALLRAIGDEVDLINASIGTDDESGLFASALEEAHKANIPIIAAAGNDWRYLEVYDDSLPASDKKVITVASLSPDGLPSWFTSYSRSVDLIAPGEDIKTTFGNSNSYGLASGTSLSTPIVASLMAILMSVFPDTAIKELEAKMESTAVPTDLISESDLFGYGNIDAIAACGFERAETPLINYDSGKYTGEITLEIEAKDNYEVYYTVDGSYPTKDNGILYTEPVKLSNDILIFKAVAYCDDFLKSECTKRFYRLQTIGTEDMFTISETGQITSYTGENVYDLIIPESINGIAVTDIAKKTFSEAEIFGVTLPDSLDFVPSNAFQGNTTLLFADGKSVTTISQHAFDDCENLYSIDFCLTETIEDYAFYCCDSLSEAFFPYCLSVGKRALACRSLRSAYFPKVETIGSDSFKGCRMLAEFYAPQLRELGLRSLRFGAQFSGVEIYEGIDLPCIETVPKDTFTESSFISKVEFSNVKEINALPTALCIRGRTVKLVLPASFESCQNSILEEAEPHWYIVYGSKGTYAEQWANENGFDFIEITPETAIITDLPEEYYSYMRPLEADVVGFNRTYQWYGSNTNSNTSGTAIDGAVERKFNPNEYKQYKYYYCIVTSTDVGYSPIEIRTGVTENKSYIAPVDLADYSGIEKLLETVPSDLSVYTEGSVERLNKLIDSINWNTEKSEQEQIDKLEKAIFEAINNLELKPADYSALDEALATIPINLSIYTDESVADLQAVVDGINRNLDVTNQEQVDKYVIAVSNAVAALKLKSANYAELEEVLKSVPSDLLIYTDESVAELKAVIDSIDRYLYITNQEQIDKKVVEIKDAVENLKLKPADYSAVYAAIAAVPSDLSVYTDETVAQLESVIESIDYTLDITNQKQVDEYAEQINEAVTNLKKECWLIRLFKMIVAFFKDLWKKLRQFFAAVFN